MNYKTILLVLSLIFTPLLAKAQMSFSFLDKGNTFDNQTSVEETIGSLTITATAIGGVFNSNKNNFGIDDTSIDGTIEGLTLSFSHAVEISSIDFSAIGGDASDGAKITTSTSPALNLELYTGILDFNGNSDVYTPATPIRLEAGETISFSGSTSTSSFEIHSFDYKVIPEMSAHSLTAGAAGLTLVILTRLFSQ